MADSSVIVNARLPQRPGLYQIAIEAGRISAIAPQSKLSNQPAELIDVEGDWISPGAIDLQINGALGLAFPDLRIETLDRLQAICELLWQQGVSGFCPTLVTTSLENFQSSLKAIQTFQRRQQQHPKPNSATVLGAHLEGPFLNPAKKGAHPAKHLQPLTLETVKTVVGEFAAAISIVTLAPELAPEQATEAGIIRWLTAQNIIVSLGHSLATEQQANTAFVEGASMVTHAFNAMPGLHHRDPGLLGAALANSGVFCGFIADGKHISKTMLDLFLRLDRGSQKQQRLSRLFLVSDALSPLGLPEGVYPWDSRQIKVVGGTARLLDGTLSGTTLPLIAGAQNLVRWGLCSAEEAIALVTLTPRLAIGQPGLEIHQPAQFLRWSQKDGQLHWQHLGLCV